MTRFTAFIALFVIGFVFATGAEAAPASNEDALSEMAIGSKDAPVTIYEYSSLTCPHCAAFHRDVLPEIKKTYVDTGKVRIVYHDFPLGDLALAGTMLARCSGPAMYPGLIEIMFRDQGTWSRSRNPLEDLVNIGRFAGLSRDDVVACLQNQDLGREISRRAQEASRAHDIQSTPTFRIGDQKVVGNQSFQVFKKIIDTELRKAQ